jgi:hypothetical protein
MSTISLRIPEDVIEDLKLLAPALGFSGYQPLLRAYVGQGLRRDLVKLKKEQVRAGGTPGLNPAPPRPSRCCPECLECLECVDCQKRLDCIRRSKC